MLKLSERTGDIENFAEGIADLIGKRHGHLKSEYVKLALETWAESKQHLFELFNGELILQKEISRVVSPDELESNSEMNEAYYGFVSKFIEMVKMSGRSNIYQAHMLVSQENFITNRLNSEIILSLADGERVILKKGSKLSKNFKYFIDKEADLRTMQDKYSNIFQKLFNEYEAVLCLSIHPYDYITISENNKGWTSCHSLDGDYAGGNINYMVDESTIVAYIITKDESGNAFKQPLKDYTGFEWNSKTWRNLVQLRIEEEHFMMISGRQYPYSSSFNIEKMTGMIMEELLSKDSSEVVTRTLGAFKTDYNYSFRPYMYNDCFAGYHDLEYDDGLVRITNSKDFPSERMDGFVRVGGDYVCFFCGQHDVSPCEDDDGTPYACRSCSGTVYCSVCGRMHHDDDTRYVHGQPVCPECIDEGYKYCDDCGEYVPIDEIHFNSFTNANECEDCMKRRLGRDTYMTVYYADPTVSRDINGIINFETSGYGQIMTYMRNNRELAENYAMGEDLFQNRYEHSSREIFIGDFYDRHRRIASYVDYKYSDLEKFVNIDSDDLPHVSVYVLWTNYESEEQEIAFRDKFTADLRARGKDSHVVLASTVIDKRIDSIVDNAKNSR